MNFFNSIFEELRLRFFSYSSNHQQADNEYYIRQSLFWFKHSRLASGEYASKYSMLYNRYFPASPETEASWISTLIQINKRYPDLYKKIMADHVEVNLADHVLSIQRPDGTFPVSFEDLYNQPPGIFVNGRIISGLSSYYDLTKDEKVLQAILKCAEWLLQMQMNHGQWRHYTFQAPLVNTMTAFALIQVGKLINENKFIEAGKKNIKYTLSLQMKNGYFTDQVNKKTNHYTDALAFTLMGIVLASDELNDSLVEESVNGYTSILSLLKNDGYLPGEIDDDLHANVNYCCLSGNCLLSSVGFRLYKITGEELFKVTANKLLQYVKDKQLHSRFHYLSGGITGSWPISGQYNTYEIHSSGVKHFIDALAAQEDLKNCKTFKTVFV